MVGWLPHPPRVVHGERLMLGSVQSTPVTRVSFLPGPEPAPRAAFSLSGEEHMDVGLEQGAQPWILRSLFGSSRH